MMWMMDRETCGVMGFSVSGKDGGRMVPTAKTRQRHIAMDTPR